MSDGEKNCSKEIIYGTVFIYLFILSDDRIKEDSLTALKLRSTRKITGHENARQPPYRSNQVACLLTFQNAFQMRTFITTLK